MNTRTIQAQALASALCGESTANYAAIRQGFAAKGIADAEPRVNVFTFNAWRAQGRTVRRGEHGVKITTWIETTRTDKDTGETSKGRRPKATTVFHVSQTDALP